MGAIIFYYSYTGNTQKYAEQLSKTENADICEIKDTKRPGKFKAYVAGCFKSLSHGTFPVEPIDIDYGKYDKIMICSPVWAGFTAPQINHLFDLIPKGKSVDLRMISSSGAGEKEKMIRWVESKGYKVSNYIDVKKGDIS